MTQPTLFLVRGLPGSGKTTLAERLRAAGIVFAVHSADDHHAENGGFDWRNLEAAHIQCKDRVMIDLEYGQSVAVANTFVKKQDIRPYIDIAQNRGARVVIIDCSGGGMSDAELAAKNIHGVPEATIAKMRRQWESW